MIGRILQRCSDGEASKLEKALVKIWYPKSIDSSETLSKLICECSKESIKPKADLFTHVSARIEQEKYREKFSYPQTVEVAKPHLPWAFVGATCALLLVAFSVRTDNELLIKPTTALAGSQALNVDWVRSAGKVNIIKSQDAPILWVTKRKVPTPNVSDLVSIEKAFPSGAFPQ